MQDADASNHADPTTVSIPETQRVPEHKLPAGPEAIEAWFVSVLVVVGFGLGAGLAGAAGQWVPAVMLVFSGTLLTVTVWRMARFRSRRRYLAAEILASLDSRPEPG